jgi:hypothetical protein
MVQVGYWVNNVWMNAGSYPSVEADKVAAELKSRGFEVDILSQSDDEWE